MNKQIKYYEEYFDSFNYYNLITMVNPYYKLFFDKRNKCFIVTNSAKNNQICYKFNSFMVNLPKILAKTKIENSKKLFKEIDDFNENNSKKIVQKTQDELKDKLFETAKYSSRTSHISKEDLNKIIKG